jgi:uncharacterized protein (TIGR02147 family)
MSSQAQALRTIQKVWNRKKETNSEIRSLRKLALKLKLSPGYLSKILSGQKPLSEELARKFVRVLSPDDLAQKSIMRPFESTPEVPAMNSRDIADLSVYEIASADAEWLLGKWYRTTLLDLMTLKNFVSDPRWMAEKLGISVAEVETSLAYLARQGLAFQNEEGCWRKKHLLLRFPTETSKKVIREHHKSNLQRAAQVLDSKILPKDFQNRLIISLSLACNPDHLQEVKTELHRQLLDAASKLSEGDCLQIYQLNLQLFPQTKGS